MQESVINRYVFVKLTGRASPAKQHNDLSGSCCKVLPISFSVVFYSQFVYIMSIAWLFDNILRLSTTFSGLFQSSPAEKTLRLSPVQFSSEVTSQQVICFAYSYAFYFVFFILTLALAIKVLNFGPERTIIRGLEHKTSSNLCMETALSRVGLIFHMM